MVLKRIALSGASGMVGRAIIQEMIARGVTGSLSSRKPVAFDHPSFSWSHWDLLEWKDPEELGDIFGDVDAVIHAGASVPTPAMTLGHKEMFDTNVRSCLALGEWAISCDIPLVYISGAIVYEDSEAELLEEASRIRAGGFGGFYGSTKFLAEQVLFALVEKGLRLTVLRPTSIYGPGMSKEKIIPKFLIKSMNGEQIRLRPPVKDKVNLIHSSDVARASIDVIESEVFGVFNLAGPSEVSIEEIADACVVNVGAGRTAVESEGDMTESTVRYRLSCRKANEKFGYEARIALSEGIRSILIEDFNEHLEETAKKG
ncbi:MAG: hypothetical protein CME30_00040 [Gemmatimonadetes bacterium]|nr:hypothetical protein [Gemmatimonadota bacterium]